jgi:hypothetical protein
MIIRPTASTTNFLFDSNPVGIDPWDALDDIIEQPAIPGFDTTLDRYGGTLTFEPVSFTGEVTSFKIWAYGHGGSGGEQQTVRWRIGGGSWSTVQNIITGPTSDWYYLNILGTFDAADLSALELDWSLTGTGSSTGLYALYIEIPTSGSETPPEEADPILYYKCDETSGTTAVDSAGDYDGEIVGAIDLQQGRLATLGHSYLFRGGYIQLPVAAVTSLTAATITGWFNWSGPEGSINQSIFEFANGVRGNSVGKYAFLTPEHHSDNRITFKISVTGASGTTVLKSNGPCPVGSKVFYAVTISDSEVQLYINGVLHDSRANSITLADLDIAEAFFGKATWPGDPAFAGLMDDIAIYNRVLGPDEILNIYDNDDEFTDAQHTLNLAQDVSTQWIISESVSDTLTFLSFTGKLRSLTSTITFDDEVNVESILLREADTLPFLMGTVEFEHVSDGIYTLEASSILFFDDATSNIKSISVVDELVLIDVQEFDGLLLGEGSSVLQFTDSVAFDIPGEEYLTSTLTLNQTVGIAGRTYAISVSSTIALASSEDEGAPIARSLTSALSITQAIILDETVLRRSIQDTIIVTGQARGNLFRIAINDIIAFVSTGKTNTTRVSTTGALSFTDSAIGVLTHIYDSFSVTGTASGRLSIQNVPLTSTLNISGVTTYHFSIYNASLTGPLTITDAAQRTYVYSITDILTLTDRGQRQHIEDIIDALELNEILVGLVSQVHSSVLSIQQICCVTVIGGRSFTDTLDLGSFVTWTLNGDSNVDPDPTDDPNIELGGTFKKICSSYLDILDSVTTEGGDPVDDGCVVSD